MIVISQEAKGDLEQEMGVGLVWQLLGWGGRQPQDMVLPVHGPWQWRDRLISTQELP